jgi:RNA polymerase sigma-70 factor (ECF subfamily)
MHTPTDDPPARADRFEALFARHYPDVAAYCLRRSPTPHDAEESATETFAVLWRRLGEAPDGEEARLWLFGVARHVVANQARSARRQERLRARLAAEPASHAPDPAERSAGDGAARRALAALPDGDRELLMLVAWEELTVAEIARVLRRPAPVVSARLSRARRRFAHLLDAARRREGAVDTDPGVAPAPAHS